VCGEEKYTVVTVGDSEKFDAVNLLRHCPLVLRLHCKLSKRRKPRTVTSSCTFRRRKSSAVNFSTSSSLSRLDPPQTVPSAAKEVLPFPRFLFISGPRDFDFRDSWSRSQILPKFNGTGGFCQYATAHAYAWSPNFEPSSRPWNCPIHWATKFCRMQPKKKTALHTSHPKTTYKKYFCTKKRKQLRTSFLHQTPGDAGPGRPDYSPRSEYLVKLLSCGSLVARLGPTSLKCFPRVFFKTLIAPGTVRKYVCFYNLTQLIIRFACLNPRESKCSK
jgi:hypothetical protein